MNRKRVARIGTIFPVESVVQDFEFDSEDIRKIDNMVRTASTMLPLGTAAPSFSLQDTTGKTVAIEDFKGLKGVVIVFMCNHCPYVKHVAPQLSKIADQYMLNGIAFIGISSNDAKNYPEDSPQLMKEEAEKQGYHFPYLYDPTQKTAKAYRAACTPDFFVFDSDFKLVYRGQMDDSRPKSDRPLTGNDLRKALDHVLNSEAVPEPHRASVGCNIKWLPENEPDYFNPSGVNAT